jgi:hypothetical protein
MAYKKKVQNKAEKVVTEKKIDWDKQPELVSIIGKESKHLEKGKEYKVNREMAKILVEKGVATLK